MQASVVMATFAYHAAMREPLPRRPLPATRPLAARRRDVHRPATISSAATAQKP